MDGESLRHLQHIAALELERDRHSSRTSRVDPEGHAIGIVVAGTRLQNRCLAVVSLDSNAGGRLRNRAIKLICISEANRGPDLSELAVGIGSGIGQCQPPRVGTDEGLDVERRRINRRRQCRYDGIGRECRRKGNRNIWCRYGIAIRQLKVDAHALRVTHRDDGLTSDECPIGDHRDHRSRIQLKQIVVQEEEVPIAYRDAVLSVHELPDFEAEIKLKGCRRAAVEHRDRRPVLNVKDGIQRVRVRVGNLDRSVLSHDARTGQQFTAFANVRTSLVPKSIQGNVSIKTIALGRIQGCR